MALALTAAPFLFGMLALLSLIEAWACFRQAKIAPYFLIRRDAGRQAWRWIATAALSLLGIGLSRWLPGISRGFH